MKNKKLAYLLIFIIFLFSIEFFFTFYGMQSMFFVDTSREAYIPMAMNDGGILYKDIFNVYPPLGYMLNAFLFKYFIFKENLNTLYFAGFINSNLILLALFLIMSIFIKVRKYRFLFFITLFFMSACIYSISLTNYIFPYSYSMVYALCAFLWSLYFILCFVKNNNSKSLFLSFFLFGLSLSFKPEFILFGLVLLITLFIKKCSIKTYIYSFLCFIIFPLVSVLILFKQGCSIQDLYSAVIYMKMLTCAKSTIGLYKFLGLIPTKASVIILLKNLLFYLGFICISLLLLYRCPNLKKNNIFFTGLFIILTSVLCLKLVIPKMVESNAFIFTSSGIFAFLVFCFVVLSLFVKKKITIYDKAYIIIASSAILSSIKSIFAINFNSYGIYFFPLFFIVIFIFFIHYLPRCIKKITKTSLSVYLGLMLGLIIVLIFVFYGSNITRAKIVNSKQISSSRGMIYVPESTHKAITETINFISKETKNDDKILVLPEGAMINFLTDRKSDNRYFYLIPPNIEIFGEENIVSGLKNNLPEYIILQSMSYINFGETFFCESFGVKICSLIPEYYQRPLVFGDEFWIAVYKKKDI